MLASCSTLSQRLLALLGTKAYILPSPGHDQLLQDITLLASLPDIF